MIWETSVHWKRVFHNKKIDSLLGFTTSVTPVCQSTNPSDCGAKVFRFDSRVRQGCWYFFCWFCWCCFFTLFLVRKTLFVVVASPYAMLLNLVYLHIAKSVSNDMGLKIYICIHIIFNRVFTIERVPFRPQTD